MGWYGSCNGSYRSMVNEIQCDLNESGDYALLEMNKTCYGTHIWTLTQDRNNGTVQLSLFLCRKDAHGWMYKPMDINCNPFYYDAPQKLVDKFGLYRVQGRARVSEYGKKWLDTYYQNKGVDNV